MFYSKFTNGFYDPTINFVIPDDAVEITQEEHITLIAGQAEDKVITSNENGFPILVDRPYVAPVLACSAYQIRQALNILNLRETVEAAVASGSQELKDAWQFAQTFHSNNSKILEMAAALSLTTEQLNGLFTLAQQQEL